MYVEQQLRKNPDYKAACDLSDTVSCSKTFKSAYASILGISNIYVGLAFYTILFILALIGLKKLVFIGAIGAVLASLYLGYLQYVKLKIFCPLCTALYVVNLLILLASYA
jgi:vitamin-K-epoxide reductase (warfarin-sensitive)